MQDDPRVEIVARELDWAAWRERERFLKEAARYDAADSPLGGDAYRRDAEEVVRYSLMRAVPIVAALDAHEAHEAHEAGTVRVPVEPTPETLELVARELSKPHVHGWVQRSIIDLSDERIRERLESEWPKFLPEATKALDTLRSRDALFKIANGLRGIGDEPLSEADGDALESAIELLVAMAVLASRPTGEE